MWCTSGKIVTLNFWGTQVLLWGHWSPCLALLVTSVLGFKASVDASLACSVACGWRFCIVYCSLRFPGYTLPKKPPSLFWWADAQFLHNQDNRLVVSVAAYEDRGSGWTPLVVTRRVEGLTYTMNFDNKICKCQTYLTLSFTRLTYRLCTT